jgi:predicted secreted protein
VKRGCAHNNRAFKKRTVIAEVRSGKKQPSRVKAKELFPHVRYELSMLNLCESGVEQMVIVSVPVVLVALAVCSLCVAACTDMKSAVETVPTTITLKVGERYILTLPGRGATGYLWEHDLVENVVTVTRATGTESQTPPLPGQSYNEAFTIEAHAPGQVTIHFVQRRPWEPDKPPTREFNVKVEVSKDR